MTQTQKTLQVYGAGPDQFGCEDVAVIKFLPGFVVVRQDELDRLIHNAGIMKAALESIKDDSRVETQERLVDLASAALNELEVQA